MIEASMRSRPTSAFSQAFDIDLGSQKEIIQNHYQGEHPLRQGEWQLDTDQARIAIRYVPDAPGMAAQIFTFVSHQEH